MVCSLTYVTSDVYRLMQQLASSQTDLAAQPTRVWRCAQHRYAAHLDALLKNKTVSRDSAPPLSGSDPEFKCTSIGHVRHYTLTYQAMRSTRAKAIYDKTHSTTWNLNTCGHKDEHDSTHCRDYQLLYDWMVARTGAASLAARRNLKAEPGMVECPGYYRPHGMQTDCNTMGWSERQAWSEQHALRTAPRWLMWSHFSNFTGTAAYHHNATREGH
jgi:hypothetical protein